MQPQPVPRFELERLRPKFDWMRTIDGLPANDYLFCHELCGGRCSRQDKKRSVSWSLTAATISHVAITIGRAADEDGRNAHLGIDTTAARAKRSRITVIKAIGHLERVGLLMPSVRGGTAGVPRTWATNYYLSVPPAEVLREQFSRRGGESARIYDWFEHQPTQ